MIKLSLVLAVVNFFLSGNSAKVMALPLQHSREDQCTPIGLILDPANDRFPAGSLICKGDSFQLASGEKVRLICYLNKRLFVLTQENTLAEACIPQQEATIRLCSAKNRKNCQKPKGPGDDNKTPEIIRPYSSELVDGRPFLSWYTESEADSYSVEVEGVGVHWQQTVKGTTLAYPADQPTMHFGNAYKISVVAKKNNSPFSASQTVINLLPESEVKQIVAAVKLIKNLGIPKDKAVYRDLDTLYMSKQLLDETIENLELRVREASQDPEVYRVLGDRYLEAGLPERAKSEYKVASKLAKESDNSNELARALTGLQLIEHYKQ